MSQAVSSTEFDVRVVGLTEEGISSKTITLRECVRATLKEYFIKLDGIKSADIYELFLREVEWPLLEMTLQYTHGNQSEVARILKLSRGTLRKKMHKYGLLKSKKK
jgi:Fis family transcriptional regulator